MTQDRYQQLVNAYGAEPSRWPHGERANARAFVTAHPKQAAKINAEAQILDQMLDTNVRTQTNTALLMGRIAKAAHSIPQDGIAANDQPSNAANLPPLASRWKSIAATLAVMTSIGFAAEQSAAALSDYTTAQALLALNVETQDSAENWLELLP